MKSKGGPRTGQVVRGSLADAAGRRRHWGSSTVGCGGRTKGAAGHAESLPSKGRETHLVEAGWSGGWLRGATGRGGPPGSSAWDLLT